MSYLLGVDGGNSKTVALVADLEGRILGSGRSGCSDIYGAPSEEAALAELDRAVEQALIGAGVEAGSLVAGVFSLAGADWPEDFELLESHVRSRGYGQQVKVYNDAIGALRAGSPDGTGVSVVCGTGMAIGARSPEGKIWHTSFWQEPQGAQELGHKALRAVMRAELGIDPPTKLRERLLAHFAAESVEGFLHALTARGSRRRYNLGSFARVLLDTAVEGDPTALRIVLEHGRAIGDYALAAARQVGIQDDPFYLVLAGGVIRHPSKLVAQAIIDRVLASDPDVRPVFSRFEPAVGALLLAYELAGIPTNDELLARIACSLPPASLFET